MEALSHLPRSSPVTNSEDDENTLNIWGREESPFISLPILPLKELKLGQYGSSDERWGIHSCVWDGGVGALAFFAGGLAGQLPSPPRPPPLLLDIGSGTGVVGLGLAFLGYRSIVTDLPEALPLLEENIALNNAEVEAAGRMTAMELSWGAAAGVSEALRAELQAAESVVFMGADVVYKPYLFTPLIETLLLLFELRPDAECWIANQSMRTYFRDFLALSNAAGIEAAHVKNVRVPEGGLDPGECAVEEASECREPGLIQMFRIRRIT